MRLLIVGALVAVAYVAAAVAGFDLAFVAEQVTTVWAPTGIAQAALLLWGVRLWPAIWIGAFIANATTDAPLWTAALIASGNTLEAVSLTWLLPRQRFDPSLVRFADAARLIVCGAVLVTALSATIGVTTLCLAGVQPWNRYIDLWSAWWLGDALGALVVAPLILTMVRSMSDRSPRVWLNYIALLIVSVSITQLAFGELLGAPFGSGPLHYVLFPLVILSAVRFGQPSTALVVFSASAVTIFNTVRGVGPFATPDVSHGLVLLQAFMGVLASTGLLLAASVSEGLSTQRRLTQSEEQLRDADRRKDEFLAVLAHELRNPLAPIRTGLELVRLAGDDPRTLEQIRPMMERQITHMVRLIDDLLDVSRITSGKIHLQREHARLSALVNAAVDANRTAIEFSGAQLSVQLPPEPLYIDVDPTRFVQVLSNLLHNAAKFTGANGRIEVRARIDDRGPCRELEVSVSDSGIGIPPELLPRVFDLFTQGERPINRGSEGLGIGLSLARRIVDLHGGRIEARSDGAGKGSTFVIRLPLPADIEAPPQTAVTPASGLAGRRVLVIDDNADGAEMLARVVQTLGGQARTATDGASGIALIAEFQPDVILLDIGMPGMDGYETCRRIRAHETGKRAFIVAVTGWGQDRDKQLATAAGFDAHLTKPADPDLLQQLLTGRSER